jgi:hypothetical protein
MLRGKKKKRKKKTYRELFLVEGLTRGDQRGDPSGSMVRCTLGERRREGTGPFCVPYLFNDGRASGRVFLVGVVNLLLVSSLLLMLLVFTFCSVKVSCCCCVCRDTGSHLQWKDITITRINFVLRSLETAMTP